MKARTFPRLPFRCLGPVQLCLLALLYCPLRAWAGDTTTNSYVYAVGYMQTTFRPGFTLFSVPLLATDSSLGAVLPQPPNGAVVLKWGTNSVANALPEPQATAVRNWLAQFPVGGEQPTLSARIQQGKLELDWKGALQSATNVTGPYVTVATAADVTQTMTVDFAQPHRFWRVVSLANPANPAPAGLSLNQFTVAVAADGQWSAPDLSLTPGEGAVFYNPGTNNYTATFVGEVEQGHLTNAIPAGLSLVSSKAPLGGAVSSVLLLSSNPADQVILWNGTEFVTYTLQSDQIWSPSEPQIPPGGACFIRANQSFVWQRTFILEPVGVVGP